MTPVAQHVYDRAELLARTHELRVVAELIGKNPAFVTRMRQRGWKAKAYPRRPMPADYAIQRRHMGKREAQRHYRAGWSTVARWERELAE